MTKITSVTLGSVSLSCNTVDRPIRKIVPAQAIPGRLAPQTQAIAVMGNVITLKGRLYGADRETDKATLEGYSNALDSTSYNDTENGDLTVQVEAVLIPHNADTHATFRDFTIILKVIT